MYFNKTWRGSSSLNTRCIFIKVIYSESAKHILQPGSEIFDFHALHFGLNLHRITWIELTGYQAKLNLTDFPKVQDAHMG